MRCSRLPLFFNCPSSAAEWQHPIESSGDAAELGTVVHAVLAAMVRGQEPELTTIARPSGIDVGEVERLFAYGKRAWKEFGHHFPHPRDEVRFDDNGDGLSGTCDVLDDGGAVIMEWDWKTGQVYRDHKQQMRGYALKAQSGPLRPVKAVIAWLQLGFVEVYDFMPDEIIALPRDIADNAKGIGKKYEPHDDCSFCPGRAECPAKAAYERMAANALVAVVPEALSRDRLAALYPQAKLLERAIESYTDMLRAALRDGPLSIPDGRKIELKQYPRQEILPLEAWPVLAAELTQPELAACVSITKGKLMDAIGAKAEKGCKGKDQGRMLARLKEAGAITETSFQKIQVTKGEIK